MKTIYLCFLLSLSVCVFGQNYLPLPVTNVEWTVLHRQISMYEPLFVHNYHYVPQGDTLIQEQVFAKLYRSDGQAFDANTSAYIGSYRNEGNKVLYIPKDSLNEAVLYDFDVKPGWILDRISDSEEEKTYFQLQTIDTITLDDGITRRQYNFYLYSNLWNSEEEPAGRYHHSWIEGMGSTIGFFPDPSIFYMIFLPIDPSFSQTLLCFQNNGALLYTDTAFYKGECYRENSINTIRKRVVTKEIQVFPNPSDGFFYVQHLGVNFGQKIYVHDLYGHTTQIKTDGVGAPSHVDLSGLPDGVYILEMQDKQNRLHYWQKLIKKRN